MSNSAQKRRLEFEGRRAQIAREASGEARGFRYAIECEVGWVGPSESRLSVHDDSCTHRRPVIYEGDRESANARAQEHREARRYSGGAISHSPIVVPEAEIERRTAARRW